MGVVVAAHAEPIVRPRRQRHHDAAYRDVGRRPHRRVNRPPRRCRGSLGHHARQTAGSLAPRGRGVGLAACARGDHGRSAADRGLVQRTVGSVPPRYRPELRARRAAAWRIRRDRDVRDGTQWRDGVCDGASGSAARDPPPAGSHAARPAPQRQARQDLQPSGGAGCRTAGALSVGDSARSGAREDDTSMARLWSLDDLSLLWEDARAQPGALHEIEQGSIAGRTVTAISQNHWGPAQLWDLEERRLLFEGRDASAYAWLYEFRGAPLLLEVRFGELTARQLTAADTGETLTFAASPIGRRVEIEGSRFSSVVRLHGRASILSVTTEHVRVWDVDDLLDATREADQIEPPPAAGTIAIPLNVKSLATLPSVPDTIYAGTSGFVIGLNASTGAVVSSSALGAPNDPEGISALAAIDSPDRLVVTTRAGRFHLFDQHTSGFSTLHVPFGTGISGVVAGAIAVACRAPALRRGTLGAASQRPVGARGPRSSGPCSRRTPRTATGKYLLSSWLGRLGSAPRRGPTAGPRGVHVGELEASGTDRALRRRRVPPVVGADGAVLLHSRATSYAGHPLVAHSSRRSASSGWRARQLLTVAAAGVAASVAVDRDEASGSPSAGRTCSALFSSAFLRERTVKDLRPAAASGSRRRSRAARVHRRPGRGGQGARPVRGGVPAHGHRRRVREGRPHRGRLPRITIQSSLQLVDVAYTPYYGLPRWTVTLVRVERRGKDGGWTRVGEPFTRTDDEFEGSDRLRASRQGGRVLPGVRAGHHRSSASSPWRGGRPHRRAGLRGGRREDRARLDSDLQARLIVSMLFFDAELSLEGFLLAAVEDISTPSASGSRPAGRPLGGSIGPGRCAASGAGHRRELTVAVVAARSPGRSPSSRTTWSRSLSAKACSPAGPGTSSA